LQNLICLLFIFADQVFIDPTFSGIFVCGPLQSFVVNVCTSWSVFFLTTYLSTFFFIFALLALILTQHLWCQMRFIGPCLFNIIFSFLNSTSEHQSVNCRCKTCLQRGEVVTSRSHGSKISGWQKVKKVNSHCFKLNRSCQMLAKFSGVESERTVFKLRKRKRKFLCCVYPLHKASAWN